MEKKKKMKKKKRVRPFWVDEKNVDEELKEITDQQVLLLQPSRPLLSWLEKCECENEPRCLRIRG